MKRAPLLAPLLCCACVDGAVVPELSFSLDDDAFWADEPDYPGVGRGRILVTNNLDDTVSVLDLAAVTEGGLRVIATVPVGLVPVEREGPHHVVADPSGEHYYVGISNYVPAAGSGPHGVHGAGTADGHALKIRARDNVTVGSARVERSPGDIRMTPDGRLLLVSHFDILKIQEAFQGGAPDDVDSTLALIDPETMGRPTIVTACPGMHGIAVSHDGAKAYVSCVSDEIAVVDLVDPDHPVTRVPVLEQPGTVQAPVCYPYATTLSPDGASLWVSCYESGQVIRYDTATGLMDFDRTVQLNGPAAFGTFTSDGSRLIVPHQGDTSQGVAFIDPDAAAVVALKLLFPDTCVNPHAVRLTDDESKLMLLCEGNHVDPGTFVVLDAATREVEQVVPLGRYPDDIAVLRGKP